MGSSVNLNPEQLEAATYMGGPLLIVAGAGTGKTTVVTERIKWLIQENGVKPEEILALTFTEKAASEMESRVDVALPLGYSSTSIFTFHGFCERVLRTDAVQIGLDPGFKILTEPETQLLIRDHLFEFDLNYYRPQGNPTKFLAGLVTHFSRLKDEDISPSAYIEWVSTLESKQNYSREEIDKYKELAYAYDFYEKLKVQESVMDFADLISNVLKLFRLRPNVLSSYQRKHPYILIDEFQDTNFAQNQLAIMLAGGKRNITVVADDDQSIYRWRGAAVYNVMDFQTHFPGTKIVTLIRNYRSDQRILDRSYQLIQNNNPDRLEAKAGVNKKLLSQRPDELTVNDPIRVIWEDTVENEADCVVQQIEQLSLDEYSQVAILIRANSHADAFTQALSRKGIPFQFLGPGRLFKQPEVRELMAYLKIMENVENDMAMYKVISNPRFSIPGREINMIVGRARHDNSSVFRMMEKLINGEDFEDHGISDESLSKIQSLLEMILAHLELVPHATPGEVLYQYLNDTGMLVLMKDPQNDADVKQIENISAFFQRVQAFETLRTDARIRDFNNYLEFLIQAGEAPVASEVDWQGGNAVSILTVHSSKGLEFDYVFLVNLVDLRFPSVNRADTIPLPEALVNEPLPTIDPHIGEERRLFYVGMTRARKKLFLTGARFYHDAKRPKKLSPFVREALGENIEQFLVGREVVQENRLFDISQYSLQYKPTISPMSTEVIEPHKVTYLSYSQIETFKTCPLHYKLSHIVKIPQLPSAALSFGDSVHNTLRDVYTLIKNEQVSKDLNQIMGRMEELFMKNWIGSGYSSKAHEQKRYQDGLGMLKRWLSLDVPMSPSIHKLEEPFSVRIAPDLQLGGRIDRIDLMADGCYEVLDYKTGQQPEDRELKTGDKGLQMCIYAIALNHPQFWNISLDKLVFSFYYLETGNKVTLTKTQADIEEAKAEILRIREHIENSNFECNHGFFCQRGCEYSLFCN
ncbi:UvrD-helicase domain-containing protein [candidate division WWE3 bacterium]|nr:UvrD-helicase domain-containing protein [candidate division WWE3 bacterium]